MGLAGKRIVSNLGIKSKEQVLIITDKACEGIAKDIGLAVRNITKKLVICLIEKLDTDEPPMLVAHAMQDADVVIAALSWSLTHTRAVKNACKFGTRIATLPGIDEELYNGAAIRVNPKLYSLLTKRLARILTKGKQVQITNKKGTKLWFSIKAREGVADFGIIKKGDYGNLPGGEAFIAPIEDSANGVIVDWKDNKFFIQKGKITKIKGESARSLMGLIAKYKNADVIAEFGIGTNPKARIRGNILEDEKVLGTCHIAFGNNLDFGGVNECGVHYDRIIEKPTIAIDGNIIMKEGRFRIQYRK